MFARIDVNGNGAHPVYRYLKAGKAGLLGSRGIKWNFTKFLVDRTGKVVDRVRASDKAGRSRSTHRGHAVNLGRPPVGAAIGKDRCNKRPLDPLP